MEKRYALYDKKSKGYLGFSTISNDESGECVGVTFQLEHSIEGSIWLAKTQEQAEKVRTGDTRWYNASYETPVRPIWFYPEELEIREIVLP
jgi:hypothetical protein